MSKVKTLVMSPADSNILNFFSGQFDVIESDRITGMIEYEQYHADLQILKILDSIFVNSRAENVIKALRVKGYNPILCDDIGLNYPLNVALNVAVLGDSIICKHSALNPLVSEFCKNNNIKVIDCKQGYTGCSTLVVDEKSIITDDSSVEKSATANGIDVLKVSKGDIVLTADVAGFIGGCSKRIGESIYFFGDVNTHRDGDKIQNFIASRGLKIVNTLLGNRLTDIGSIITV